MAHASQNGSSTTPRTFGGGYLFGVPLGDLGWFTSLLMSFALGFAAFFAATFCAIVGGLFYSTATHHTIDFALTYKRVGLPVGVFVLMVTLGYLGRLWVRRQMRRS
ncbi:hypothetical protein [Granulicella sp. L60]|jgi:hypothetical protein|uniref:hypothetical protein n=1 Tax=Granulicella sp. L60 TaxID=1641866 RepID=UPI00131CFB89|nr:hypothetical protein [Granulicella sp. L60]